MGLLIAKSDFLGKYKIAQNSFTDVDSYINRYEKEYLVALLGAELYDLFEADVIPATKVPATQIYIDIYQPFAVDDNTRILSSKGMKDMVLGFIYFEFVRDDKYKNTVSGNVVGQSENNRESGFSEFNLYSRYNEAIDSYWNIQCYINKNLTDYPEYNGQHKSISHWAI
jgi:hypothetical protein